MLFGEKLLEENDIRFEGSLISRTVITSADRQKKVGRRERLYTAHPADRKE